jgi:uncharacterized membrane protein YccC
VVHIAALDRTVDEESAGSLSGRRDALRIRRVSGLLLELIALTSRRCVANHGGRIGGRSFAEQRILELSALARASDELGVANALDDLLQVLRRASRVSFGDLVRDFDITSAVRAALRPIIAVALAVALWWSTAWQMGSMMVMTAALFSTLFSSHDQGDRALIQVLFGSLIGALAGLICRLCLLPYAQGIWLTLLCIAPFLLLGAWLMLRPATAKLATDINMTFLLTAQPRHRRLEPAWRSSKSSRCSLASWSWW